MSMGIYAIITMSGNLTIKIAPVAPPTGAERRPAVFDLVQTDFGWFSPSLQMEFSSEDDFWDYITS
jgi:hypothetical protein